MSEDAGKQAHHLWFTRHQGGVKGPFPAGLIRRFVLLGRLQAADEVSADREQWFSIGDIAELMPEEMLHLDTEEGRQRYLMARMREDERLRERRSRAAMVGVRRHSPERRVQEEPILISHREVRRRQQELSQSRQSWVGGSIVLAVILTLLVGIGLFVYHALPSRSAARPDCAAPPAVAVNWSNCNREGLRAAGADFRRAQVDNADLRGADLHGAVLDMANLAYTNLSSSDLRFASLLGARLVGAGLRNADLSHARFDNADLSFVDLRGANIDGALFRGARLDKAIWVDGRVCADGSVGRCLRTAP